MAVRDVRTAVHEEYLPGPDRGSLARHEADPIQAIEPELREDGDVESFTVVGTTEAIPEGRPKRPALSAVTSDAPVATTR